MHIHLLISQCKLPYVTPTRTCSFIQLWANYIRSVVNPEWRLQHPSTFILGLYTTNKIVINYSDRTYRPTGSTGKFAGGLCVDRQSDSKFKSLVTYRYRCVPRLSKKKNHKVHYGAHKQVINSSTFCSCLSVVNLVYAQAQAYIMPRHK